MTEEKKILVGDLLSLREGLDLLGNLKIQNFKLNYAIEYNIEKVKRLLKIGAKTVNEIRKKHAKKDEQGEPIVNDRRFSFENQEALSREIEELENQPIDEFLHKFKVSTLEKEKIEGLTPRVLSLIGPLLERDIEIPNAI